MKMDALTKDGRPPKEMKVTFVLPGMNRSGGVRVTMEMACRLQQRGIDTRVAYRRRPKLSWQALKDVFKNLTTTVRYRHVDWMTDVEVCVEPFVKLSDLKFERGEIVIAVGVYTVKDVYELNRDVKKVRFNHGFSVGINGLTRFAWGPLPMVTITVSNTLVPLLEEISGQKVAAVIPNGVNPREYFVENKVRDGIGFMYSSHPNKAPQDLLRVVSGIKASWPEVPIRCFSTEKKPKGLEVDEYVRYPSISRARELYNRSLIWLVTSYEEGLPGPVLEAMACGCCVVSSDNLGSKEIIEHNVNGVLVCKGDIRGFLDAIGSLLLDKDKRDSIAMAGMETVKRFSWDVAVSKMEEFLRSL